MTRKRLTDLCVVLDSNNGPGRMVQSKLTSMKVVRVNEKHNPRAAKVQAKVQLGQE